MLRPLEALREWLLSAPSGGAPERFFGAFAERLVAETVPLWRASAALHSLSPEIIGQHLIWVRGEVARAIDRGHDMRTTSAWIGSPVEAVVEGGERKIHVRLDDSATLDRFPVLNELARAGGRDYLIFALDLSEGLSAAVNNRYWQRQFVSFASDAPEGFSPDDVQMLEQLVPALSLRMALEASKHASRALLRAYLGPHASRRVLTGAFRRGTGESVKAVILFCDMRGFTSFSESRSPVEVVKALDEYFDRVATPIEDAGGEVLKFIGDAVLGMFPVGDQPQEACQRALTSARSALENLAELNQVRSARGDDPLGLGMALHVGEVMYGNIGSRGRLDFTVIGSAVNEVCRVESLTRSLNCDLLLTREFVSEARLDRATSLGAHALKGVGTPIEVYRPD